MGNVISNEDEKVRVLQNEELDIVTGGVRSTSLEYILIEMEDLIVTS